MFGQESEMNCVTLYTKDARGQLRSWSISSIEQEIIMEFGTVGGEMQTTCEAVPYGKASRSLSEQIESRINSRIQKKLDKGYVYDVDEAKNNKKVNQLGFPRPMLAQRIDKVKNIRYDTSCIQRKYDGHRCMIINECGELIAYSRNGKIIDSITEILESIKQANIPEGTILDGELYLHGEPLQTITSLIKKRQERTKDLIYICYDVISDFNYHARLELLCMYKFGPKVSIAHTIVNIRESDIPNYFESAIKGGYEGLILRQDGYGYEDGKKSKGLVKIKQFADDDFTVFKISSSKDGWAILHCFSDANGTKEFTVSAPGSMYEKEMILKNKHDYIGKIINVKYSGHTKDGIPFHPIAVRFIEKL